MRSSERLCELKGYAYKGFTVIENVLHLYVR